MRNQLSESQKYIFAHNVTQSDEYRQAVLEPMQRIEARVKNLASDDETALEIISALSEPNERLRTEKLAEVAEGMGEYHRSKLAGIESDLDLLFDKKEELFAKSEQAGQEIERNKLASKAQESEKDKLAREPAADQVWRNVVKQLPFMTDEDGKVLDEFKDVQKLGRAGINPNNSIGTQAFAGYATQLVPKMATLLQKNADKIQELESAISALKGSSPSINNGSHQKPVKDNRTLSEIVMDRIAADS